MGHKFLRLFCFFLVAAFTACAPRLHDGGPGTLPESNPSRKIDYFSFLREDESVSLMVDVELAAMRVNERYLPLSVTLANKNLYQLSLDRDSFILVDADNETYLMPGFDEVKSAYQKFPFDAKYYAQKAAQGGDAVTGFSFLQKEICSFFPHPYKDGVLQDALVDVLQLPRNSYIADLIYFPMPKMGFSGRIFGLRLDCPELDEPFEVTFIIKK